ncbi:MFS transporter [Desulfomonile tiedjei]|uniref:Arabinose efflux permease family protein n=1 Tax=Desulfomonile tiedjei (strain ATCC 49306 / DSM 6799 / DCB-1) TaxID=706587 RepID=I4C299_DESTA|nr:MFS transporter [Desulfomonile tiedjei]AFM23690.1 arabinose efflux permease family protein [Desulfomonile tiedjei DSM 6799]
MNPSEGKILAVTNAGHFAIHYNMMVFPALVLPLADRLGLSMAQVVELSFLHYLFFGLSALPWGLLGDRLGGRKLMMLLFVGSGLSGIAVAASMTSPFLLSISLASLGLFSGIYHPIGMGLISKGVSNISRGMGQNAVAGGVGQVMGPLLTGILNWLWGPTAGYLAVAVVNFAGAALMLSLTVPEGVSREPVKQSGSNGMIGGFVILLVGMLLAGLAYSGSTVILNAYLELKAKGLLDMLPGAQSGNISPNLLASLVTALVYTIGAVGQYCGGIAGARYETRYAYLVFHATCIPAAFLMAFTTNFGLVASSSLYFFCLLGMQPLENTLVARFTPSKFRHSAYGLKFILAFGVGSIGVKIAGWINANWGNEAVFVVLGFTSIAIVCVAVALIWWTNRSREQSGLVLQPQAKITG